MEHSPRVQTLKAAIQEGIESGISDMTVPEIIEDVEARLHAEGRLPTDTDDS